MALGGFHRSTPKNPSTSVINPEVISSLRHIGDKSLLDRMLIDIVLPTKHESKPRSEGEQSPKLPNRFDISTSSQAPCRLHGQPRPLIINHSFWKRRADGNESRNKGMKRARENGAEDKLDKRLFDELIQYGHNVVQDP